MSPQTELADALNAWAAHVNRMHNAMAEAFAEIARSLAPLAEALARIEAGDAARHRPGDPEW